MMTTKRVASRPRCTGGGLGFWPVLAAASVGSEEYVVATVPDPGVGLGRIRS
jgi:hypothetical protein